MTFGDFFSQLFTPITPLQCQPTHEQRRQNENFSVEIEALNLDAIRKQHGRIDERYEKVLEDSNLQSAYRVEKYMKLIRAELQKVDNYCNMAKRYGNKLECIQQMDGLILQNFEKPFIKSQLKLYKVANLCLIKGKTMTQCIQEVKKQNILSLQNGLKDLKELVNNKCR